MAALNALSDIGILSGSPSQNFFTFLEYGFNSTTNDIFQYSKKIFESFSY